MWYALKMHKLLLALFIYIFVVLIFPQSEVFAVCSACPAGTAESAGQCVISGGRGTRPKTVGICPTGQIASPAGVDPNDASCSCVADPAAPAPAAPTKVPDCGSMTDIETTGPITKGTSCPAGSVCYKGKGLTIDECFRKKGTGPAAAPCTGPNCTKGGGQPCTPGSKDPNSTGPGGIKTAIGCIPTEPSALVAGILKFATLGAGGIAFLLMILGALGLITAEGNPEAIKHSQERFYSAIVGLLFIVFSVLLLQVIGVDILDLPGFYK